jgi:hypothetical protein
MTDVCHDCGDEYERLSMHWTRSSCDHQRFTERQLDIITGLLLGDADLHNRTDPNPLLRVRMTNEPFLGYLSDEFGVLSTEVYLERSAEEQAAQAQENKANGMGSFSTVNRDKYNSLYGIRTMSHPDLHQFVSWYSTGEKRFPANLELTPDIARMWYICDGWLAKDSKSGDSDRVMIKASNEADRVDYLINLLKDAGFDAGFSREAIQISAFDTDRFLQWMGSPPPGFHYKWDSN